MILLVSDAHGDNLKIAAVIVALAVNLVLAYLAMLIAMPIQRLLGLTGLVVVSRIVGLLLASLSLQFIFDGIKGAGIFTAAATGAAG